MERAIGMQGFTLREAKSDDARFITQMVRAMVEDMAHYGGYAPASDAAAWEKIRATIADDLNGNNVRYVIVESAERDQLGIAGAELITLSGAFAAKQTLHISVVYVRPPFRRAGIANALVASLLDWGRAAGAEQCTLNVLSGNPARTLYEKHGFSMFELKMSCPL